MRDDIKPRRRKLRPGLAYGRKPAGEDRFRVLSIEVARRLRELREMDADAAREDRGPEPPAMAMRRSA